MKIFKLLFLMLLTINVNAKTIILDVGHNDKQLGTRSSYGSYEFYYNQLFVKELAIILNKSYALQISGFDGKSYSLEKRTSNSKDADLFLSIHHDAVQEQHLKKWSYNGIEESYNDEVKGFSIFVSEKNIFFDKSLKCAKILGDKLVKEGYEPNLYHSLDIDKERKNLYSKNGVYQYDNLIVLKTAKSPAILVEVGVLTNRQEAKNVLNDDFKNDFFKAIEYSLEKCLK